MEIVLTDPDTGEHYTVRVSGETAYSLGLVEYDGDGNPVPVGAGLWPDSLSIPLGEVFPTDEDLNHPVGNALATFLRTFQAWTTMSS